MIQMKIIIATAILLLAFTGCVKDNGNYDYRNIPEFTADGYQVKVNGKPIRMLDGNRIVLNSNDSLTILVNGEFSETTEAAYEWAIFPKAQPNNPDGNFEQAKIIATGKDFNQSFHEGPGKYVLYFKAIAVASKNAFYSQFVVEVESIKGLLVFHSDAENKGDYSAIRTAEMNLELPEEKLGVIDNIYSGVNNGEKIANPTHIWLRTTDRFPQKIFLASPHSITTVNYETHEKETDDYSSLFLIMPEKSPFPEGYMNGENNAEYLIQNGDLCKIDYMSMEQLFGAHVGLRGKEYAPWMMCIPTYQYPDGIYRDFNNIFFNKTDRKFEYDFGGILNFRHAGGSVDISDTRMDLVYMAKGNGFFIEAVMKDDNGNLHYVRFNITDANAVLCTCDINLSGRPEITEQSQWAVGARGNIAFFSSQNELYILNHNNQSVTPAVLGLPDKAAISVVKVLNDPENYVYDNALIFIGYNLNGKGYILQYQFNPLDGRINKDSRKAFSGFGQIVDVVLKK